MGRKQSLAGFRRFGSLKRHWQSLPHASSSAANGFSESVACHSTMHPFCVVRIVYMLNKSLGRSRSNRRKRHMSLVTFTLLQSHETISRPTFTCSLPPIQTAGTARRLQGWTFNTFWHTLSPYDARRSYQSMPIDTLKVYMHLESSNHLSAYMQNFLFLVAQYYI